MIRIATLLGLAMLATVPAWAQPIDLSSGGPVSITARDGFEWREADQEVIATGDARAVRGDVTVIADRLIAHYRKKAGAAATPAAASIQGAPDTGGNEVYRLEAEGNVRIYTTTDEAVGDRAVYDIDQAVMVMTGHAMKLTTPQQVLTARDSMEYWAQQHMAVGRGHATVVTTDGRQVSADTLVGYTTPSDATPAAAGATPPPAKPVTPSADPLGASGKLQRVEAFGNVEVRTAVDIARGDRGIYLPDVGIARLVGHVRVTHDQNEINGPAADVNMKTGIAHVISDPSQRVQGLIVPNDTASSPGAASLGAPKPVRPAPLPRPKQ